MASKLYKKLKLWNELGECLCSAGQYEDAASSFLLANNALSALRAYEKGQLWDNCLVVFERIKRDYPLKKRVSWIRRLYQKLTESYTSKLVYSTAGAQPSGPEDFTPIALDYQLCFSRLSLLPSLEPLNAKERFSLLSGYSSYDQIIAIDEATVAEMETEANKGNLYAYSSLGSQAVASSRCRIATVDTHPLYQYMQKLVEIACRFEEEAQLLSTGKQMAAFSGQYSYFQLPANVSQAISILERLDLRKSAFLLANCFNLDNFQLGCLERLAVSASALPFLKATERFEEPFRRFGKLWSVVAAKTVHRGLESLSSACIRELAESESAVFAGLVMLGYWKKVVSLSNSAFWVAAAFGDFTNVKLLYLKDKEIPTVRRQEMLNDPTTWPSRCDCKEDVETLLCNLEETFSLANSLCPLTLNAAAKQPRPILFHRRFPWNQSLWNLISLKDPSIESKLSTMFTELKSTFTNLDAESVLETADFHSFFVQLIFAFQLKSVRKFFSTLSFEKFEAFLLTVKMWIYSFDSNLRKMIYMPGYYYRLRGSLAPFGIRLMSEHPFMAGLPIYSHALVSTDCVFFSELVQRGVKLQAIDNDGNLYLAPISTLIDYLRLCIVKLTTEIVLKRKELYEEKLHSPDYPFKREQPLLNEQLRAYTAACIYGEICHLRTIQQFFPNEYRFVGKALGSRKQNELRKMLSDLLREISELSGQDYEHDDPQFAAYLKSKNKEQVREKTKQKNDIMSKLTSLFGEMQREEELSEFLETLPISVHMEMTWLFEHEINITALARVHLMAYMKEEMSELDYNKEAPKLRLLDNLARLCCCQPYLASIITNRGIRCLLFPEAGYASGDFLCVIQKNLEMIRYPFSDDEINRDNHKRKLLRFGLDMKEKFLLIERCILWSLVLTRHHIILPTLFAVHLTRYVGSGLKLIRKKIQRVHTNISICHSLHLLCDMIECVLPGDQLESISHTVLLLAVSVIANTSWEKRLFAFCEVIRRLFFTIKKSPLRKNENLLLIAKLDVSKLGLLSTKLRQSRYLTKSITDLTQELGFVPEEEQSIFIRDTHTEDDEATMLPELTEEELKEGEGPPPSEPTARAHWYEGRDLELVVQNEDFLNPIDADRQLKLYTQKTKKLSILPDSGEDGCLDLETMPLEGSKLIEREEDQLLFEDLRRHLFPVDIYPECALHFRTQITYKHFINQSSLILLQAFSDTTKTPTTRQGIYKFAKLLMKCATRLDHYLVTAIVYCRKDHQGEVQSGAMWDQGSEETGEEQDLAVVVEETQKLTRAIERGGYMEEGRNLDLDEEGVTATEGQERGQWKRTK